MRRIYISICAILIALLAVAIPGTSLAQCPTGRLQNPGFETGEYKTEGMGTSLSSSVGEGWVPWSVLGDATVNREVEYKVLDVSTLPSGYHIHSGGRSQKFFTTWGTHTAGFYQRVAVPKGSKVTFSIWAQIYTGERELTSGGEFISDLDWPEKQGQKRGPGLYSVYAGVDPYGDTPSGFGAPPSDNTVWTSPVLDSETRQILEDGRQIDAWVQLTVSTIAQSDYVTVYTKGQPQYSVKHNDSFWDDACLQVESPPTSTPRPTLPPTETPLPSETALPTETPAPSDTPQPTATATAEPTSTNTPVPATATAQPSETPIPATNTPAADESTPEPSPAPTMASQDSPTPAAEPTRRILGLPARQFGSVMIYVGIAVVAIVAVIWLRLSDRS